MIQANELRIGNWVKYNGKPIKVYNVSSVQINEWQDMSASGSVLIDELSGIELTEEILLKCGAILHGIEYIVKAGALLLKIRNHYNIWYSEFGNIYLGDRIKYLHELQNLFHTLTGKELEVNL